MDEVVHGSEHRMVARGNTTSFPSPWQDLLTQLSETAKLEELGRSVSSPRTGEELTHVVSILLNTSNAKEDGDKHVTRFIHQAMVRRSAVMKLIVTMKRRGHRAYKNIDMDAVIAKSAAVPEHDVPLEIIRCLPLDDLQTKMDLQDNNN